VPTGENPVPSGPVIRGLPPLVLSRTAEYSLFAVAGV